MLKTSHTFTLPHLPLSLTHTHTYTPSLFSLSLHLLQWMLCWQSTRPRVWSSGPSSPTRLPREPPALWVWPLCSTSPWSSTWSSLSRSVLVSLSLSLSHTHTHTHTLSLSLSLSPPITHTNLPHPPSLSLCLQQSIFLVVIIESFADLRSARGIGSTPKPKDKPLIVRSLVLSKQTHFYATKI